MRHTPTLSLLVLALGCYDGAPAPSDPAPAPRNDLRILGGAVECDGCDELEFSIGGPDLQWVTGASFVSGDDQRVALPGRLELRRFTGDSGIVLQVHALFTGSPPIGVYDLMLLTPGRPGDAASMVLEEALRVTRVAPPTQPQEPPTPPGPPEPPEPPGPPPPPWPPLPSGTLRVTVSTSGQDPDFDFRFFAGPCDDYYYYSDCFGGNVSTTQALELRLPATTYGFTLSGIAPNCQLSGANSGTVKIVADSTSELHLAVTCVALSIVEVSVPVTGSDVPEYIWVGCLRGGCPNIAIQPPGPVVMRLASGSYVLGVLSGSLPPNCTPSSAPRTIEVWTGNTVQVTLPVTCQPLGEIHVVLNAPNPAHVYRVQFPDGCDNYYVTCYGSQLSAGSSATFRVFAGAYSLRLLDVPANCQVTSANPASVTVSYGVRSELAFDVTCQ